MTSPTSLGIFSSSFSAQWMSISEGTNHFSSPSLSPNSFSPSTPLPSPPSPFSLPPSAPLPGNRSFSSFFSHSFHDFFDSADHSSFNFDEDDSVVLQTPFNIPLNRVHKLEPHTSSSDRYRSRQAGLVKGTLLENTGKEEEVFSWKEVLEALKLPQLWLLGPAFFFAATILFGLAYFSPSIIQGLGYTAADAQLMSVPASLL